MSIQSLVEILQPPDHPLEVPTQSDWAKIEQEFMPLPSDYKAFIVRYGTGYIDEFIWILNPFAANRYGNLILRSKDYLGGLREIREAAPDEIPYPIFPEQGGVLPFGFTDNGDFIMWETKGQPDNWTVLVQAPRDPEFQRIETTMTTFLSRVLTEPGFCIIFPDDIPSPHPTFKGA
jgi:hypothetical protein